MATERGLDEPSDSVDDKLTDINGIGPAAQRDLHGVGIRQFAHLIQHTPEKLAKLLFDHTQNARYSAARIANDNWIGQARELMIEGETDVIVQPRRATAQTVSSEKALEVSDWNAQAEFTLYFESKTPEQGAEEWQTRVWQTRIRDKECDIEETFDVEPAQWVNWILEHAQLTDELSGISDKENMVVTPAAEAEIEEIRGSVTAEIASIDINNIELSEAAPSARSPRKNLVAEVRFQVTGVGEELLVADVVYQVEIHIINLDDGTTDLVTHKRSQLQPGEIEYTSRQAFPIPELGRYAPQAIVLLLPPLATPAIHQGNPFNIVQ